MTEKDFSRKILEVEMLGELGCDWFFFLAEVVLGAIKLSLKLDGLENL